mmetsp:Transcript_13698/g.29671  ORF Transcript_13698/g.29671 Transcript_13698/m.29671 type:complete len:116 (-) Transcript_13698:83-430(-)|eukprot:CAMPEP_0116891846 /NCGR_PEP_ID=MMETSP0467-20121206/2178_1 /TAXON_ID=283647 /ORGANISM="Mesodinium pulex, Strain SPMC105" /LENGTH=115 /DNA_ID=CAMNT_0004560601 /DNA_START=2107 /DNA_END=2454 /DNA_ORIENTATION=-
MAIHFYPKNSMYYLESGKVKQKMGQDFDALQDFDHCLKMQPKNPYVWFRKGFSLKNIGDVAKASVCLQKANKLSEQHGENDYKLKVNVSKAFDVKFIEIFLAGREPEYPIDGKIN